MLNHLIQFTRLMSMCAVSYVAYGQIYNANQNSYWPMTVGSRWIYQSESSDSTRNGMVTVFEVLSSPSTFGCLQAGSPAQYPFHIGIFKIDPRAYWNINSAQRLRWMLGVQPSGYTPTNLAGSLFGLGWYRTSLDENPFSDSTINLRSTTPLTNLPYLLLRSAGGTGSENSYLNQYQWYGPAPNYGCGGTLAVSNAHWTVTYTPNQWYSTPGYTGYTLKAQYDEVNNPNINPPEEYLEDWYFAQNTGPVVVHTHKQYGVVPDLVGWQRLKLVSYTPGSGSPGPAGITLRDALIAQAGVTSGLNWDQWNYYFARVTNLAGPYASYACVSNPSAAISVDTYLNYLESIGGSCPGLTYPPLSNGQNANSALQSMINQSGASRLRFEQWNWYLNNITGIVGQAPQNVCMTTVMGVVPNRYLLLTPRQWLLYYEHYYIPSALPCWS